MRNLIALCVAGVLTTGCATMFSGQTQTVQVNATINNAPVQNINCYVSNGRGNWNVMSSSSVTLRRDGNPLVVNCSNQNKTLYGVASIEPYYNTTNLWNIGLTLVYIVPGVVGWIWDGADGTTNEYPHTINVQLQQPINGNSFTFESSIESKPVAK